MARLFSSEAVANHLHDKSADIKNELDAELTRQGFVRSRFAPPNFKRDLDVEALRAAAPRGLARRFAHVRQEAIDFDLETAALA